MADTLVARCLIRNVSERDLVVLGWLCVGPHLNLILTTPNGVEATLFNQGMTLPAPALQDFIALHPGFVYGRVLRIPVARLAEAWETGGSWADGHRIWPATRDPMQDGAFLKVGRHELGELRGEYRLRMELRMKLDRYRGAEYGLDAWTGHSASDEKRLVVTGDDATGPL